MPRCPYCREDPKWCDDDPDGVEWPLHCGFCGTMLGDVPRNWEDVAFLRWMADLPAGNEPWAAARTSREALSGVPVRSGTGTSQVVWSGGMMSGKATSAAAVVRAWDRHGRGPLPYKVFPFHRPVVRDEDERSAAFHRLQSEVRQLQLMRWERELHGWTTRPARDDNGNMGRLRPAAERGGTE